MTWTRRLSAAFLIAAGVAAALCLSCSSASATTLDPGTRSPDAARIATGYGSTCAIDDGLVECWGSGQFGQLANGSTDPVLSPPGPAGAVDLGGKAIQVVTGDGHACALLADGSVRCWGRNNFGQLGYGRNGGAFANYGDAPGETPAAAGPVPLGATAIAISAGGFNTCALLNDGRVRCWGFGGFGENGLGNQNDIGDDETPASAPAIDLGQGAIAVTTGASHSCALLDDGTVRCWGHNDAGQLGNGNTNDIGDDETPTVGGVNLGNRAVSISAGDDYTCAVLGTGAVRCWGDGADGRLGDGSTGNVGDQGPPTAVPPVSLGAGRTAIAIATGSKHACALLDDGSVRCWGSGRNGRLGYGNTDNVGDGQDGHATPASAGPVDVGGPAIAVSAGDSQTCARLADGTIRCWGLGLGGQLGQGSENNVGDQQTNLPASVDPVDTGATPEVRQVAAGTAHTCALTSDGTVHCWGAGTDGQLGYGNTDNVGDGRNDDATPASAGPVDVGGPVKEIAAGGNHTCALRADGLVYCWGSGVHGELGYGNTNDVGATPTTTPADAGAVSVGRNAIAITVGDTHTCAVLAGRVVRCWGEGAQGELGYGNPHDIGDDELPSDVPGVPVGGSVTGTPGEVRMVQAGYHDTCAVLTSSARRCWGNNQDNQLGTGNTAQIGDNETPDSVSPISLGVGRRALGFAQGLLYTCATLDNGAVRCWGNGTNGLGYGNTDDYLGQPTTGSLDLGAGRTGRLIGAGETHTCVVMDNGQMRCWGVGSQGQLGTGSTTIIGDTETPAAVAPVNVGDGRRVVSAGLGDAHTCAVLDDGTLRCWGEGADGRLGTGSTSRVGDTSATTPDKIDPVDLFDPSSDGGSTDGGGTDHSDSGGDTGGSGASVPPGPVTHPVAKAHPAVRVHPAHRVRAGRRTPLVVTVTAHGVRVTGRVRVRVKLVGPGHRHLHGRVRLVGHGPVRLLREGRVRVRVFVPRGVRPRVRLRVTVVYQGSPALTSAKKIRTVKIRTR